MMKGALVSAILLIVTASHIIVQDVGAKENYQFNFEDFFRAFQSSWGGKMWDEERREEGKEKIRYLIRDREGETWRKMPKNGSIPKQQWIEDGDIKLLIHSYSAQYDAPDSKKILKDQNIFKIGIAYGKQNSSINIIIMDWTTLSVDSPNNYHEIVENVPYAADAAFDLLQRLKKKKHIKDMRRVHLVGFGMGAHVAGMIGEKIKEEKNMTIGRITGLDPNGPGFAEANGKEYMDDEKALTKKDAEFVDVIHCNMGKTSNFPDASFKGRYGSTVQSGHADFYPNGGEKQSGCGDYEEKAEAPCSQRKCSDYFSKTIQKKYLACPCDDYDHFQKGSCECTEKDGGVLMGEQCSSKKLNKQRYYLDTKENGSPVKGSKRAKKDKMKSDNENESEDFESAEESSKEKTKKDDKNDTKKKDDKNDTKKKDDDESTEQSTKLTKDKQENKGKKDVKSSEQDSKDKPKKDKKKDKKKKDDESPEESTKESKTVKTDKKDKDKKDSKSVDESKDKSKKDKKSDKKKKKDGDESAEQSKDKSKKSKKDKKDKAKKDSSEESKEQSTKKSVKDKKDDKEKKKDDSSDEGSEE